MSLLRVVQSERVGVIVLAAACVGCVVLQRLTAAVLHVETEVEPEPQPETKYITQETEDSLKASTLVKLLAHHNFAIRDVAAKIVYDRALNDKTTMSILMDGIACDEYDIRLKSLRALANITDQITLPLLHRGRVYRAFVSCLDHCITDTEPFALNDRYWDEYPLRDMVEKFCLVFLKQLVCAYGATKLVEAGFVETWLGRQNWGVTLKERNINFCGYQFKQNKIVDICQAIVNCDKGKGELQKARLLPSDEEIASRQRAGETKLAIVDEPARALQVLGRPTVVPVASMDAVPRVVEQSEEELRLRHRHREAMVLNDGTTPLGRSDIFERQHDSPSP